MPLDTLLEPTEPPVVAAPGRFNLLTAAGSLWDNIDDAPAGGEPDWTKAGLAYARESCFFGATWDPCGDITGTQDPKTPDEFDPADDLIRWQSFGVWTGKRCSTFGSGSSAEQRIDSQRARARRMLIQDQARQIEGILEAGDVNGSAFLDFTRHNAAPPAGVTLFNTALAAPIAEDISDPAGGYPAVGSNPLPVGASGSGLNPVAAIASVENYLCDRLGGAIGMVHVPVVALTYLVSHDIVTRVGDRYLTPMGHIVVPGCGYDGLQPDGTAAPAGSAPVYATSLVHVKTGPILVFPDSPNVVDWRANNIEAYAERIVNVGWDGCAHGGVLMNLCGGC